ncbi:MAG: hypothetical protein HYZ92_02600 [Candidatus Omnitrophica bacterium]|nr:hypothetical protein [Candidatus Omnitrophota bacterium]
MDNVLRHSMSALLLSGLIMAGAAAKAQSPTLAQLTRLARHIVVAKCRRSVERFEWGPRASFIYTTFEVVEMVKGDPIRAFTLKTTASVDSPRFSPGDQAVLLLGEDDVQGYAQPAGAALSVFRARRSRDGRWLIQPASTEMTVHELVDTIRYILWSSRQESDGPL